MKALKHMEAIFGALAVAALLVAALPEHDARAAVAATATAKATAAPPAARTPKTPAPSAVTLSATPQSTANPMIVVVIKGKRMSAREKRRAALTASAVADPVRT
jgi:hypothetical protein